MNNIYSILLILSNLALLTLCEKDTEPSAAEVENLKSQRATIYDQFNGVGSFYTLSSVYEKHLGSKGWDNRARSICVTGVWLVYDFPEYNKGLDASMEYFYGSNNNCFNFNTLAGRATSIRFAGSPTNPEQDTITFYETVYFQGEEEYLLSDTTSLALDLKIKSIIVTGLSRWTIYDQKYYGGNSLCIVTPGNSNPTFISSSVNIGAPWGSIRSVRKGCFSANEVTPNEGIAKISFTPRGIHQIVNPIPVQEDQEQDQQFIIQ